MTITFACECGKRLQVPESVIGSPAQCPVCGAFATVPDPALLPFLPSLPGMSTVEISTERAELPLAHKAPAAADSGPVQWSLLAGASLLLACLAFVGPLLGCSPAGRGLGLLALLSIPAIGFGVIAGQHIRRSEGRLTGLKSARAGIVTGVLSMVVGLFFILLQSIESTKTAATRAESLSKLHNIGSSLIHYEGINGTFPPADKNGLSWRVHILPFTCCDGQLYDQFKLDEPWDSPRNIQLLGRMPWIYRSPRKPATDPGMTCYRCFVGPGTVLGTPGGVNLANINNVNAASRTLLVVEASEAVPWTKPDELPFGPGVPLPELGPPQSPTFCALFADGHVQMLRRDMNPSDLRRIITWHDPPKVVPGACDGGLPR